MRSLLVISSLTVASAAAWAGPNVGISIDVVQPGVYGQVIIGNAPPPPVVSVQPVIVAPPPVAVMQPPVYVYVPVAYQQNWRYYCGRYAACGRPVLFVQEQWVRSHGHRHDDEGDDHDGDHGHERHRHHHHDD